MEKVSIDLVEAHITARDGNGGWVFLLLKRSENESYPGLWQMVSGSTHHGELPHETAKREIFEETGIAVVELLVVPHVNSFYSQSTGMVHLVPVFLAVTNTKDVKISEEHSAYQWVTAAQAANLLAWPGQRRSVEIINEFLTLDTAVWHFNKIVF